MFFIPICLKFFFLFAIGTFAGALEIWGGWNPSWKMMKFSAKGFCKLDMFVWFTTFMLGSDDVNFVQNLALQYFINFPFLLLYHVSPVDYSCKKTISILNLLPGIWISRRGVYSQSRCLKLYSIFFQFLFASMWKHFTICVK